MLQLAEAEYQELQKSFYLLDGLSDDTPVSQKVRRNLCAHQSLSHVFANGKAALCSPSSLRHRSLLVANCLLHCAEHNTVCRAAYPAQEPWKLMLE